MTRSVVHRVRVAPILSERLIRATKGTVKVYVIKQRNVYVLRIVDVQTKKVSRTEIIERQKPFWKLTRLTGQMRSRFLI